MRKKYILILSFILFILLNIDNKTFAQQHQVCTINWSTHQQNMWGPSWQPLILDFDYDIININFVQNIPIINSVFRTCLPWPLNNVCACVGISIDIQLFMIFRATFSMHGFTTGYVDVDYPVRIDLTFPANYSFNHGSVVTINSQFDVLPGWDLTTHFPSLGVISLDVFYAFGVMVPQTTYTGSCNGSTIDLIQSLIGFPLHIGTPAHPDSLNIIYINSQTGQYNFPCFTGGMPGFCHGTLLPITFNNLGGSGLSGWITIPYVVTHDWYDPTTHCLYAHGDSTWLGMELDILQFIAWIANFIPGGQVVAQVIGYLNGSYTLDIGVGSVTIEWHILQVGVGMNSTTTQDFSFCPDLLTTLDFPTSVEYTETPPGGGTPVASGNASSIQFHTGNDLNFHYPCYGWPQMDISTTHEMHNNFTNHTWDSISFYFYLRAFSFNFNINILGFININIPIPWLINMNLPLGYIPLTWYDNTWNLPGFTPNPYACGTVTIIPNPEMTADLTGNVILCAGSNSATIITTVEWGTPPFTYDYTGADTASHNTTSRVDSLTHLGPGWYYVLVTDVNGCQYNDSVFIAEMFPPLAISHTSKNVTCIRGHDGQATVYVTGGAPGYTYFWTPSNQTTAFADSLYAGWHYAAATDSVGCIIRDSVFLIPLHPRPPVNIDMGPMHGCSPVTVNFSETNSPDSVASYLWHFGDSAIGTGQNITHTYWNRTLYDQTYDVTLTVISIHGCDSTNTFPDTVTVFPLPEANFSARPTVTDIVEPRVWFTNYSVLNDHNLWSFGDGAHSTEIHPNHSYLDTGKFTVDLLVTTVHGCRDSMSYSYIIIKDIYTFYIPNAFTPNEDGLNDVFLPSGHNISNQDYSFYIYDRWGQKVFESHDLDIGWDGTIKGVMAMQNDVYVWKIDYRDTRGFYHKRSGRVFIFLKE